MAVVEEGNRLYMTELGSIKHAYKTEYSILGKEDHVRVHLVHEGSESMYMHGNFLSHTSQSRFQVFVCIIC